MNLKMERITKDSRFWDRINALAKEAFPPEEYLSPDQLVEMPDRSAQNYVQRQRRRNFYLRNGYRETGQFLTYRGVDYEVFCMEEDFDPGEFAAMLNTISLEGFHPVFFRK